MSSPYKTNYYFSLALPVVRSRFRPVVRGNSPSPTTLLLLADPGPGHAEVLAVAADEREVAGWLWSNMRSL